jgi:glycosyltransferase involved in cell wall biosynthesis
MGPRPHVLCVMQLPPPVHGVTTINAQIATSATLAEHFALDVLPLQFSTEISELGLVTVEKLLRAGSVAARLAWHLATRRPAAVYFTLAVQRPAIYRDLALLSLVRAAGVRRIVHLHARPEPNVLPALRRALHGATVILLSPALRAELGDAVTDEQIRYVPNGIADVGEIKRGRSLVPRVLFLSNLLVDKGPLVLADALAELARRGLRFEATFAGEPSREISAQVLRDALDGRAQYVGAVGDAAKRELLRYHDIFAYPSARDAFPLAVIEAMSAGLAIVASDVGAISEITGDAALLVAPNDPRTLADALAQLITLPSVRAELGRAARERYLARFTLASFEAALVDAINAALSTR